MSSILFISDFFTSHLDGGAENNDSVLIDHLSKNNDISLIQSHQVTPDTMKGYEFVIVSNFTFLSEEAKEQLEINSNYIIYEHDHKYVIGRDPSKYPDFEIPDEDMINVSFYEKANCVVVLSEVCKEIIQKNIPDCNVYSIGCSLWSQKAFELLEKLSDREKTQDFCVVNSSNPIKRTAQVLEYCKKADIKPILLEICSHDEFLFKMSSCKKLIFFPAVLETFSRLCAEAKMLNLSVLTTPKKLGFASESIFKLSGKQLVTKMRERNDAALKYFDSLVGA